MNKTDFKTLIVILVVLLIFSIIVLILYNVTEKEKIDMSGNFIVDGNRFFEYDGTKWRELGSIDSIIMNKFNVYSNNTYVGNYSVSENNGKYYFFDDEYESHDVTSPFIAISEDSEVSVIDYKKAVLAFSKEPAGANNSKLPDVKVVDLREEILSGNKSMIR